MKRLLVLGLTLAPLAAASTAAATGAWSTYIRPAGFTDLVAGKDSVWFATANAGIVLYDRRTGATQTYNREFGGLAGNSITSLDQDRAGRPWVGTDGGLSQLGGDGRWRLVNLFDGLPSDSVTVLKAYGDSLWIGTEGGLAFWNGEEISGRLPDGVNPSPFASDRITGVAMLGDSVWAATTKGVYLGRMSNQLQSWTTVNTGLPTGQVDALVASGPRVYALSGGLVWVVGAPGWSPAGVTGLTYALSESRGQLFAATSLGIQRLTAGGWTVLDSLPSPTGDPRFTTVCGVDEKDSVFAAQDGSLYLPVTDSTWTALALGGPIGDDLVNLHFGQDGAVYMATFGLGVSRFRDGVWTSFLGNYPSPPVSTQPWQLGYSFGLLTDRIGRKWFTSWGIAIHILDDSGPADSWKFIWNGADATTLHHTWGWSSAVDSSGGVWIGSDSPRIDDPAFHPFGLDYYDAADTLRANYTHDNTGVNALISDQVRALCVDKHSGRNRMIVGCASFGGAGGVCTFDLGDYQPGQIPTFTTLDIGTSGLAQDVFGVATYGDSLWVLSSDSLRLFLADTVFARYEHLAAIAPLGAVHPLEVTSDGSVWTASSGGIRVYHPGGATEDFTVDNSPLASNTVRTIRRQPGSDVLWIATDGGVNRYDPGYRPPPPPSITKLAVRVYPNPVHLNGLGVSLTVSGNATAYAGDIYSIDGRRVRALAPFGNGTIGWDGRDEGGALVRPGVYFLRLAAGGHAATVRFVVLR